MRNDSGITNLLGPRAPLTQAGLAPPAAGGRIFRSLGRILVSFAALLLLLSIYLGCVDYWLRARWIQTDAEVMGVEAYESVHHSARRGMETFYGVRYTVSFRVNEVTRQSQLDFGPAFSSKVEAEAWATRFPQGSQIPILYKPPDGADVRSAGDAPNLTALGTLKLAGGLFLAGLLALVSSKAEVSPLPGMSR